MRLEEEQKYLGELNAKRGRQTRFPESAINTVCAATSDSAND